MADMLEELGLDNLSNEALDERFDKILVALNAILGKHPDILINLADASAAMNLELASALADISSSKTGQTQQDAIEAVRGAFDLDEVDVTDTASVVDNETDGYWVSVRVFVPYDDVEDNPYEADPPPRWGQLTHEQQMRLLQTVTGFDEHSISIANGRIWGRPMNNYAFAGMKVEWGPLQTALEQARQIGYIAEE
jgi:hypothetical protein